MFIDADKAGYVDYYEAVLPKLSERGPDRSPTTRCSAARSSTRAPRATRREIVRFNAHVAADARTVQVILPVRDGVTLIRRA